MDLAGNVFKWYKFCIVISFVKIITEILRRTLTKLFRTLDSSAISIYLNVKTAVFEKTTTLSIF